MKKKVISVIGPSDIELASNYINITKEKYISYIKNIAHYMCGLNIEFIINSDSESTLLFVKFLLKKLKNGITIIQQEGAKDLFPHGEKITKKIVKQRLLPYEIVRNADLILVIGFGIGTILEICLSKFESNAEIIICKFLITRDLPIECKFEKITYVENFQELKEKIAYFLNK